MELIDNIDKEFKKACRIVLGGEVGELTDFEEYLSIYIEKTKTRKSFFSGEELEAMSYYPDSSRFVKEEEIPKIKVDPVSIDEVKDIDSLFEAAEERLFFVGNSILGNSQHVEKSTTVNNSSFIFKCVNIMDSKICAYTSYAFSSSYMFGVHGASSSTFSISSIAVGGGTKNSRIFESFMTTGGSTNIYFSHRMDGCSECFFSFFQSGKRHLIGNLQLEKEKYMKIKGSLLEQIRDELEAKKTIRGIHDIVGSYGNGKKEYRRKHIKCPDSILTSFKKTTKTLFGKEMDLNKVSFKKPHCHEIRFFISDVDGDVVPAGLMDYYRIPEKAISRMISLNEAGEISKRSIAIHSENITFSDMMSSLDSIAYYSTNIGSRTMEVYPKIMAYSSSNSYMDCLPILSKNMAFNFCPRNSSNVFYSSMIMNSNTCISCTNSNMLNRCYDCDFMRGCSDSYMSHNCENCRDVILCSSLKSKRNCVINTQFSQEEYKKVKEYLLEWINRELDSKGTIPISMLDVFSGEWKAKI